MHLDASQGALGGVSLQEITVCLDVGGTYIKGLAVENATRSKGLADVKQYAAHANVGKTAIIQHFSEIITSLFTAVNGHDKRLTAVLLAFPGPFDYRQGISLIQGLNKYESLYQVNVVAELTEKLRGRATVPLAEDFSIQTFNDATAFAFGEYPERQEENFKGAYFTLGTGCGSTFIEKGQMVRNRLGIPSSGMIYDCPFKASIIDDYVSARGLARIVFAVCGENRPAPLVYEQAKAGQAEALNVFQHFGQTVGQALAPFVAQFLPDELVFGGQISKSFMYMQPSLLAELKGIDFKGQLRVASDTSFSTILGLKNLAKRKKDF